MPDKGSKQHISKSFTNQSWKNMQNLLDKELPAGKSENKMLIYSLLALLLLSLFLIGYLGMRLHYDIPVASVLKERIVYKSSDTATQPVHQLADQIRLRKNTENSERSSSPVPKETNSWVPRKLFFPAGFFYKKNSLEELDSPDFLNDQSTPVELPAVKTPDSETRCNLDPPALATDVNSREIEFNLGFLTFAANNLDFTGYGVTTGVEFPIGKKLGLNTGVAINFVSRDFLFYPIFQQNVRQELYKYYNKINLEEQGTYYSGLRSFNQIYIPLGLTYNVNEALAFNSGVKFRYTYSEEIDPVLENLASKKIKSNESAENVFFNHTNVGLYAGVKYSFNERFSINLDSEWGVSSLIQREEFYFPLNKHKYDLNLINLSTNIKF